MNRNQDSPNLFFGNSEIISALALIYLFDLDLKDIQVIFLESIEIPVTLKNQTRDPNKPEDPFYYIYKNVLSQGGEPIYIKNLKKKYKISRAFSVSINWDTPRKINLNFTQCDKTSKTYKLYNDLIDKYMDLKPFEDKFILKVLLKVMNQVLNLIKLLQFNGEKYGLKIEKDKLEYLIMHYN